MENKLAILLVKDISFLLILITFSLFLVSFYFHAQAIDTGYPDWIVHAFRIKTLNDYGFLSWTHTWANGISLWKTYQFLPHMLTIILIRLTHVTVTRAMVLMTIILFVFLRVVTYCLLRILHFSATTAFVCSVLSYDIAQYWGGVSDYSLMFGFAFFPLAIFCWTQYFQGKIQYLFPYILGILFYIHPILGCSSVVLWVLGMIFSKQKLVSKEHCLQFFIFMASSSLFWYPLIVKHSYLYSSPNYANKYFLNLVLSGYAYFGLSIFLLFCLLFTTVRLFFPIETKYQWTKVLSIFSLLYFIFILIGLNIDLPRTLSQFQFTRGATIVGISIVFASAGFIEDIIHVRSRAIKSVLLCLLVLVFIEGLLYTSTYSPQPSKDFIEPVESFTKTYGSKTIANSKIWSSDIGPTSYYAPVDIQLPYSYMGQADPNQISPRISPLILYQPAMDKVPLANLTRLTDYFKIAGTQYLFFDEDSPFTKGILSENIGLYKDLGVVKNQDSTYHIFKTTWEPRNAVAIDKKYQKILTTFPFNLQLDQIQDQITLDEYVQQFVQNLYQPENTNLRIVYPSQDSMEVAIPQGLTTKNIYIDESYDSTWKAFFNKQKVVIKPVGPNFMEVILPKTGVNGIIYLRHVWPLSFYISVYLIFLIPLEIGLVFVMKNNFSKRK